MEYWGAFAVMSLSILVSMYIIQNLVPNFNDKRIYLYYFICLILFVLNFELMPTSFRVIGNTILYILMAFLLFRASVKKACLLGVFMMLLNILVEIVYVSLSYPIINHTLFFTNNSLLVFFQNTIIGIMIMLVSLVIKKRNIYLSLISKIDKIKDRQIIIFSLLCVVIFNLFMWLAYFISEDLFNNSALSFVGSAISLFSVALVFSYLKTNSKYMDISEKYTLSLDSIKDYEQIIDNNRVNNHEIRNQFLMLRSMSKNKKITGYIDSILNNNLTDNEELLNEVIRIPSGGLRGLIYTKLLYMKEKNINYELHVDKKINTRKINKIDSGCMIDICKIIGVFLDNAIEEVITLKERNITVEIYADRTDIVISITNNFDGYIKTDSLDKTGYTTKSEGHGYGLKLVSAILKENNKLENYKEIYENNFTQNLKIKM